MMYSEKVACAIKVNGLVLREFNDKVYLPFGSEYSIFIKNLHTRKKAVFSIFIDGVNVSGGGYLVNPDSQINIERFVESANKFKFIEKTASVEQFRGNRVEDGLIRIEWQFAQYEDPQSFVRNELSYCDTSVSRGAYSVGTSSISKGLSVGANDAGITALGGKSNQRFVEVPSLPLEPIVNNMVIKLVGQTQDNEHQWNPITQTVVLKSHKECSSCGKFNKMEDNFCSQCGTSLVRY